VSDSRARIWFSLFVLAVFCLGGAAGIAIGRHLPPPLFLGGRGGPGGPGGRGGPGRGGPGFLLGRGPGGPPPLPPDLINRLASELQLDGSQQAQVKTILDDRRGRLEQVHRDARDRFDQEQRELHAAIRAILRPDQQQKFDRFLER
jgi:hypothetical protein